MAIRFLTDHECRIWCRHAGVIVAPDNRTAHSRFAIPSDAGQRVALARHVWLTLLPADGEVLIWVTQTGVWPSGEHGPAVNQWMAAFGERRGVRGAPGLIATAESGDEGLSYLIFAVLFLWDCWVIQSNEAFAVLTHDEW